MNKQVRCRYYGNVMEPANGTIGTASPNEDDDGSWSFQPDGSEFAYYCDESELVAA